MYIARVFLLLSGLFVSCRATTWTVKSISCSKGKVTLSGVTGSCDGGACDSGANLQVTGTVTVNNAFPSTYDLEVKVCKFDTMGVLWGCPYTKEFDDFDVCDKVGFGNNCGSVGTFNLDIDQKLPDLPANMGSNYNIHASASMIDSSGSTFETCKATLHANNSSGGNGASIVMTWSAALGAVAVIVVSLQRRRRRRLATAASSKAVLEPLTPTNNNNTTAFVELTDRPKIVDVTAQQGTVV